LGGLKGNNQGQQAKNPKPIGRKKKEALEKYRPQNTTSLVHQKWKGQYKRPKQGQKKVGVASHEKKTKKGNQPQNKNLTNWKWKKNPTKTESFSGNSSTMVGNPSWRCET